MSITDEQLKSLQEKFYLIQDILQEIKPIIFQEDVKRIRKMTMPDQPQEKSKSKPSIQMTKIIDFWNGCGMANHKSVNSETYQNLIKRIRKLQNGSFFNSMKCFENYKDHKFTYEEFIEAIRRFALMATNVDYDPMPGSYKDTLKKMNLLTFLYNPRAKKIKSFFIYCLENEPVLLAKTDSVVEDIKPSLTIEIKRIYIERILGGINPDFSQKDLNNFILASNKLDKFCRDNGRKFNSAVFSSFGGSIENKLASMLVNAIIDNVGEQNISKITPGYLSSGMTFTQRFPAYLNNQGIILRR